MLDETPEEINNIVQAVAPDVVIHLATYMGVDRFDVTPGDLPLVVESNIVFGVKLMEALRQNDCRRCIVVGTHCSFSVDEQYRPDSLYSATKYAFIEISRYYENAYDIKILPITLFYVMADPKCRRREPPLLITQLLHSARTNDPLSLTPGEQILSLTHIDDVCRGFEHGIRLLLEDRLPEPMAPTYALDAGCRVTVRELVGRLERVLGRQLPVRWGSRPYSAAQIFEPVTTLPRLPGWVPEVDLDEGLRRTLAAAGVECRPSE